MRRRPGSAPTSARNGRGGGGAVYGSPGPAPATASSSERGVADRARQHELVRERSPVLAEVGSERRARAGGLQADDAAHRRGEPDRAAHVVAVRDGDHARTRPRPRSAARTAGRTREIPRVVRRAVRERLGGDARRELGRVRLADEHEPGGAKARREPRVVGLGPAAGACSNRMPQWNGSPAVWHTASFTRNGTPRSGPAGRSAARASARARSKRSWITALSARVDALRCARWRRRRAPPATRRRRATSSAWAVASSQASVVGHRAKRFTRRRAGAADRDAPGRLRRWTTPDSARAARSPPRSSR